MNSYKAWWCDNVHVCFIPRHHIIYYLFDSGDVIEIKNHARKCKSDLENVRVIIDVEICPVTRRWAVQPLDWRRWYW